MSEQHDNRPLESLDDVTRSGHQLRRADPSGTVRASRVSRAPAQNESSINLSPAFLWWTFCQWWKWIIPAGLILAGIAATCIALSYKPDYSAAALIMVEDSAPYIAFAGSSASANTGKYVETQVELLRSSVVLEPVLGRPEIAQLGEIVQSVDRLEKLQRDLRISRVGGSELYQVAYTSKSPQAAADVANAVVIEYLAIQSDEEFHRTQRVIDLLEEERRRRSLDVERLRQRVIELAKEITGRDPFARESILDMNRANNPSVSLFQELAQLDVQKELLQADLLAAQEFSHALPDHDQKSGLLGLEINSAIASHPAIAEIQNLIAQVQGNMSNLKAKKKNWENDPRWNEMQTAVKQYEDDLADAKVKLGDEIVLRRTEEHKMMKQVNVDEIERQLGQLDAQREILTKKFEESMKELKKSGGQSIELEFARAELEREEAVFEMIASRKLAMQTELRAPTRVRLRQEATVPKRPLAPLPYKTLFLACAGAFLCPFGLTVLREMSVKRITDVEQLSRETHLPILGEISHFPIKQAAVSPGNLPGRLRRQMFLYNESIDSFRTSLMLSNDKRDKQLLVVTSAAASEGKTSVATSLAMSIAAATQSPTLVIDADMRSPDVSAILATRNTPGLAEVLSEEAELKNAIQRVGDTYAYVLPAGRLKGNPHHLLRNERMEHAIRRLREKFSTIIIDTPPIFGGSEALMFAKEADGVIISTLRDVSREKQVRGAVERLERSGAHVLGAVLNGKSANSYAYSYGYGYYSGRTDLVEN